MAVPADPAPACVGDALTRGAQRFGRKRALVDGAHELSSGKIQKQPLRGPHQTLYSP